MTKLSFACGIALCFAIAAQAEVYKSVDSEGNIIFSDTPTENSEKVRLPPIMTYSAPKPAMRESASDQKDAKVDNNHYDSLVITEPLAEAAIRDNTGTVSMVVKSEPALRAELGHRIQFVLDGVPQQTPGLAMGATLSNLDRGSHTLSAQIQSADGTVLISASPVTIFVHRFSANFRKAP